MSLIALCGVPGAGKTFMLTRMARKHYKRQNSFLNKVIRKIHKEPSHINNVYSNYPILLNKKKKIYSRIISIEDLKNQYSFLDHSFIAFDEPQLDYDSIADSFIFPRAIGMTLQMHRHIGIDNIVFATQHPNRLVVYEKNIMNEYYKIMKKIKLPFLPWGLVCARKCFEIEDYARITTGSREIRKECSISRSFFFFNFKKVYVSYDSTYLRPLNLDKPLLNNGCYKNLVMPKKACEHLNKKFLQYHNGTKPINGKGKAALGRMPLGTA